MLESRCPQNARLLTASLWNPRTVHLLRYHWFQVNGVHAGSRYSPVALDQIKGCSVCVTTLSVTGVQTAGMVLMKMQTSAMVKPVLGMLPDVVTNTMHILPTHEKTTKHLFASHRIFPEGCTLHTSSGHSWQLSNSGPWPATRCNHGNRQGIRMLVSPWGSHTMVSIQTAG